MITTLSSANSLEEAERLRIFITGVTDYAIYMLSPGGIVSSWNAGAQLFKGYRAHEIIGQHFSNFYTEEDQATGLPARALRTAHEEGKFEAEGWRVRKDGSRFWANVVIDPIYNNAGELIGFAKITRDITERKKAAEALYASEERFRLLVQGVTDYAIYMLSPEGVITNWNSGAERIKGFTEKEVVGSHFSRFYIERDRLNGLPAKALATAAREGSSESEGWRVRKDGSEFWAHVIIDPITNEMGELIGFAKITRDITERREAALALEKTQNALFQSQKMEAIGKLTGGVAHDFNNLLSVIVNGLTILRMSEQNERNVKVLDSMERATTRGATLTKQLLSFTRQQPLKQEQHDINRVITSFEAVLRRANRGSIAFNMDLESDIPPVMIDAAQFEASLLNLIVNAQDATPDSGTISLRTTKVELSDNEINQLPAGCYIKITVSDSGIGMPQEIAARAVEPFFTTKTVGSGTGLGLSQVSGFVQQSNGDLQIESVVDQGTTIAMYIPALNHECDQTAFLSNTKEKALVVDDEPDVLDMAGELFESLGYHVFSANKAEEALEILKRTPDIEVLFSDVVMPGISGIELGKQARQLNPDIKIILASGYTGPALNTDDTSIDAFQFVSKPYRMSEIIKKLRVAG